MDALTLKLLNTDDALVWAEEWCLMAREIEAANDERNVIDEGWMVGWFANAMGVALSCQTVEQLEARLRTKKALDALFALDYEPTVVVELPEG